MKAAGGLDEQRIDSPGVVCHHDQRPGVGLSAKALHAHERRAVHDVRVHANATPQQPGDRIAARTAPKPRQHEQVDRSDKRKPGADTSQDGPSG